jgi:hypothetical protein
MCDVWWDCPACQSEVVDAKVPGYISDAPPAILAGAVGFRVGRLITHEFFRDQALTRGFHGLRLMLQ